MPKPRKPKSYSALRAKLEFNEIQLKKLRDMMSQEASSEKDSYTSVPPPLGRIPLNTFADDAEELNILKALFEENQPLSATMIEKLQQFRRVTYKTTKDVFEDYAWNGNDYSSFRLRLQNGHMLVSYQNNYHRLLTNDVDTIITMETTHIPAVFDAKTLTNSQQLSTHQRSNAMGRMLWSRKHGQGETIVHEPL